jgi:hypothetical protein
MSIVSAFLLIVITVSMVITAILLVNALKNNFQTSQLVRKKIKQRIEQLPFGKMLRKHNVDTLKFLYQVPLTEIESEIRVCQSCSRNVECEKAVYTDGIEFADLGFCPNSEAIIQQRAYC